MAKFSFGEHAPKLIEYGLAVFHIAVQKHLGVAASVEAVTGRLQTAADFHKVINFPVEHNGITVIGAFHRLVSRLAEV